MNNWKKIYFKSNTLIPNTEKTSSEIVKKYIKNKYNPRHNKVFPIKTETACKLKWAWSTIYLTTETTASCHRTSQHKFDTTTFNFHNTPEKINDRLAMLKGEWPEKGCEYCKNIESVGGQSDRITNLDLHGFDHPDELDIDNNAVIVTPKILEVYFDNTCNLKCLYCGPYFSSLWDAENIQFGKEAFAKSIDLNKNKQKIFEYLKSNGKHLTLFNFLGGEPLFQSEFTECLDIFRQFPAPNLKLQIFTNLNIKKEKLIYIIGKIQNLIESNCLQEFEITASLDCWGDSQEYVRYPLKLSIWEENFLYLLDCPWINLIINSTLTPLTIKTFPNLLEKINQWSQTRKVYHYQNSVNWPDHQFIDIFGDIFKDDFNRAIQLKPTDTPEEVASKKYLEGIAKQSVSSGPNIKKITLLFNFLNDMDRRRKTSWPEIYPWLVDEFKKYGLYAQT